MVARDAGVSTSTVSRLINGTAIVSEESERAIRTAIARYNYHPNPTARGLALGRTLTIGVVTQAIDSPFYGEGLRGIEQQLQQHGYAALFMSGNWRDEDEKRCMRELLARRVDGVIMFSGRLSDEAVMEYARRAPIVVSGRSLKAKGVYSLPIEDEAGAVLATRHLTALGHRRIAFIAGFANHPDANERLNGYRRALAEADIQFDPRLVVEGDFHEDGGMTATFRLLESSTRFTAIFCVNDQTAHGACLALSRKGLRVPDDVSIVGFDDLPSSMYRVPPLTTVRQSIGALGQASAQAMVQLIAGVAPHITAPPVELIVRESTGRPARSDQ
jgi:LacI family transcriptional regulator